MDAVAVFVNDFDFVAQVVGIIPACERRKRFFNRATAVGRFADFVAYKLGNRFIGRAEVYAADKEFGFVGFANFAPFALSASEILSVIEYVFVVHLPNTVMSSRSMTFTLKSHYIRFSSLL